MILIRQIGDYQMLNVPKAVSRENVSSYALSDVS